MSEFFDAAEAVHEQDYIAREHATRENEIETIDAIAMILAVMALVGIAYLLGRVG